MNSKEEKVLNSFKSNIVNWYNFENNNSILLVGNIDEVIAESLCQKFNRVTVIENDANKINNLYKISEKYKNLEIIDELFFDINKFDGKFDYIFVMNYFLENKTDDEIEKLLNKNSKFLNEDGKILAVFKNKLGAKETINKTFGGFSRERIQTIIDASNFEYSKFYYVLPNEKYANVIFSDDYILNSNDFRRNLNFVTEETDLGFTENEFYNNVIKNYRKDIRNCVNSFFVEISKKPFTNNIRAVFFSNIRNKKYRIRTKILETEAIKEADSKAGEKHLNDIKKNIDTLKSLKINILDSYNENSIISKLATNCERLDDKFVEFYKNNDNKYRNIICKFQNDIISKLVKTNSKNNVFEKYDIEVSKETIDKMHFVKYGFWDLILQNIFIIDNEFYTYDQEWFDENIPEEFILFRAINSLTLPENDINKLLGEYRSFRI